MNENIRELKYVIEETRNNELLDNQKKELERQYKEYLKATIKETFNIEFLKNKDYKYVYNTLVLESEIYQDKIINEISNYYEEENKKIHELDTFRDKIVKVKKYIFNDFDIEADIQDYYFKILKQVYNEYRLKEKIKKEEIRESLNNSIYNAYNNYGYEKAHYLFYNIDYVNIIIEGTTEDIQEQKYIRSIINGIVNKIDRTFKNYTTIDASYNKVNASNNRKNVIRRNKGKIFLGSAVYGFLKGMYNISKK